MNGRGTIIVVAALLIALAGCGAGTDTRMSGDQITAIWGEMADLMNEMADAIGGIESQATADAVATRVEAEFLPRLESIAGSFVDLAEGMSEDEHAALQQAMEEDEDARTAFERLSRSAHRLDERSAQLEPRFVTSALEESMLAFVQASHQFESRFAESVGAGTPQPAVGDAAWCQEMANKPEAQWTMDEAFAFASRCVGG